MSSKSYGWDKAKWAKIPYFHCGPSKTLKRDGKKIERFQSIKNMLKWLSP